MPTPNFNQNIIEARQKLSDPVASADLDGTYSSAMMTAYENRAIRDLLKDNFIKLSAVNFAKAFPEYLATSTALTLNGGSTVKPTDCWYVLSLAKSDYSVEFDPISEEQIMPILTGQDEQTVPTADNPVFWQEGLLIRTLPSSSWQVIARYIATHQNITVNGSTDLLLNSNWFGEIVDRMVAFGLQDAKNGIVQ